MSIQDTLLAWGMGRAIGSAPNDYPGQAAFAKLIARGTISVAGLAEDDMIRVDAAVSSMKGKKPIHHTIICLSYVEGWPDATISRRWRFDGRRRSRSWIREQRMAAEHYLEAKLEPR